jgi:hypothetical protein
MIGNEGAGIMVQLARCSGDGPVVNVLAEDCYVSGSRHPGIRVEQAESRRTKGRVTFRRCVTENTRRAGLGIKRDVCSRVPFLFEDCTWSNCGIDAGQPAWGWFELLDSHEQPHAAVSFGAADEGVGCRVFGMGSRNLARVVGLPICTDVLGDLITMDGPDPASAVPEFPNLAVTHV